LLQALASLPAGAVLLLATKGLEPVTLLTMDEVLKACLPEGFHSRFAVLSGPSFSEELAHRLPAAVTVASSEHEVAQLCQRSLQSDSFKLFTSTDVVGVQIGGALKNVIAVAAGIGEGLELGENARAALVTRGLAEITRLAVKRGANPLTLAGLSGIGDLLLTCTSRLSRNLRVGIELGRGRPLAEALASVRTVAEGITTALSVPALVQRFHVELPICQHVHAVAHAGQDPRAAAAELMGRQATREV
jgi:glycerol-3-phosphate dehydrogenase (NAD(P)+)